MGYGATETGHRRCAYGLCQKRAKGLVRVRVSTGGRDPEMTEFASCVEHADEVGMDVAKRLPLFATPGGAIYAGDLDGLLRRGRGES